MEKSTVGQWMGRKKIHLANLSSYNAWKCGVYLGITGIGGPSESLVTKGEISGPCNQLHLNPVNLEMMYETNYVISQSTLLGG